MRETSKKGRIKKASKEYVLGALSAALLAFTAPSMTLAQGEVRESASHRFEEVADGVWFATGTGSAVSYTHLTLPTTPYV